MLSIAVSGTLPNKVLSNAEVPQACDAQLIGLALECIDAELLDKLLPVSTAEICSAHHSR